MTDDRETLIAAQDEGPGTGAPRVYQVRVVSGPSKGGYVRFGGRALVVGADPGCDLVVADPKVSRRHLELAVQGERIAVRDLNSKNGTLLDGVLVNEVEGRPPLLLQLGDSTIRVSELSAALSLPASARTKFGELSGESVAMREVFAVLERVAPSEATVLIYGESGTGKELAARAIHDHSARQDGPFVIFDCSAIPLELIESHLFGHRKGAFTGAVSDRKGAFLEAHGGTLVLDELGELPLSAQSRLLRALEGRTVQPLGADRPVAVDTRVVAATHRELEAMVRAQTFRFDLFHRLSVVQIELPPLRHRPDDLPALIRHFYQRRGLEPGPVEGPNLEQLARHSWPGNARELRNVLERALIMSGPSPVPFAALQLFFEPDGEAGLATIDTRLDFKSAKERWVAIFERHYLARVLNELDGDWVRAAARAGINKRHFRKLCEAYGLLAPEGPSEE